jgi:PAS domain S-box-containing protein
MNSSGTDANESVTVRSSGLLPLNYLQRYGLAVVSIGFALGASLLFQHFGFRVPSALLLLFAMAVSSWYGGPGPALLAFILSTVSFYWYFVEPVRTIYIYRSEIPFFITFTTFAALLSWFGTVRRRGEANLCQLNRKLRAISDCNQTLLRATDEQSLLEKVCRIVCEEAGYRLAWVGYAEHDEAKSVRPVAWTGAEEGYLASAGITWADTGRGRGQTGIAIRSGKTCCIQDFATDPRLTPWREGLLHRGFRSGIALPLKDERGNTFGSLTIHSAEPNAFTPEEAHLLEELAGDLAFGIVTLRSRAARKQAEQALRQSEAYLAEAQKLSHTGSWALDVASDKYVYVSEECLRIYGFNPQQGLPSREAVFRTIHPEDSDRVRAIFEKSLREKMDASDELRIVLPDGATKYLQVTRHPVLNDAGDVVQLVGTSMDITDRKVAEESLRRSEAYLAEAQRLSHTGSWALDVASWRYVYWSQEMFRIYGFDPQQGLPTREAAFRRLIPEDWNRVEASSQRSLREKVDTVDEYRIVLPDGTVKDLRMTRRPVLNDAGDVVQLIGTTVDITERKRAEEALRESETRFRTFVDHAGDALFVYDLEQRTIVDVNRRACEELGYTREELIGNTPLVFHQDSCGAEMESDQERAARGETVFNTHVHRRKDGTVFPVEVQTSLLSYGGRRFLLNVARDVTDRVRAEEQRDKLRQLEAELAHLDRVTMLGELTASIAHEVNQPLSGVVSNASACLRWMGGESPNMEEAREAVRRIVRDGKRAAEVVARVRALTKRTAASREKLDLNETIREVLAIVGDEAKKNKILIRTEFADDVFPVLGDRVQLQQVLLNLVMNAMEAMSNVGEDERELAITTRNVDPNQVQVTVQDSGTGLDPHTMPKIFDPFYTTKPHGMGMGLAICRSILQAHGGQLWAAANDGPGTSFHFTLPRHEAESDAAA